MRILFELDANNYDKPEQVYIRNSARAIFIKNKKIAMVHSIRFDYYKFPGGGIENNETKEDALIRETLEEAGLSVKKDSIKEFGRVRRKEKMDKVGYNCFQQDNYYYLCDVEDKVTKQNLDDYENFEHFTLEYVDPKKAIEINRTKDHGYKSKIMIEREAKVLEILISEGYFN